MITYQNGVALESNKLPESLGGTPINVYALWVRADTRSTWRLMYIGQRSTKNGWGRVKQHLFSTPKGTQSKLAQVRAVIESGAEVGVTAIHVEPDSMRLAVEEELINLNSKSQYDLPWNQKARSRASAKRSA